MLYIFTIFSRHRQKEECQSASLCITRIRSWYDCICCHNLVLQNSYLTHIPRQVKHWIWSPWCVCVMYSVVIELSCAVVLTWSRLEQGHPVLETVRLYGSAAVTLLGASWDDEGVDQVRHLRAICQHSHQHTLPFTPPQLNKATLAHSFKQAPFVQRNLIDSIFPDMNSASKVGEIFLAAGTAYSKLGEV